MTRILILLFIFLISCRPLRTHHIILEENLGSLDIDLPTNFDTTFIWTKTSDYSCSAVKMYRFQPSSIEICPETGFFYQCSPKEKISFTIMHQPKECWRPIQANYPADLDAAIDGIKIMNPDTKFIFKETRKINNRTFNIIGYQNNTAKTLTARTFLDSTYLILTFANTSDTSKLDLKTMYNYLQTVELK